uniref:Anthocyanin 5-aromatic acyltransferase n=1 Tax=Aegilops tauschii TaxID=37682 RepID=R7W6F9_AEGTA
MPPFDAVLQSLRSSLSVTLGSFAPLAGKLVHLEETGDVAISCSATDGVRWRRAGQERLEKVLAESTIGGAWLEEERTRFTRRTFTLDAQDIQRLKQHIVRLGEGSGASRPPRPPSTFAAVAALAWTCFFRCKSFASDDDDDMLLFFFTDARARLDPPMEAGCMGVCLWPCFASLPARELRGEFALALAVAASAVREEVRKMREVPVATWGFLTSWWAGRPMDRLMNVSGSPRFRAYEGADFGWGKPKRTEPIRMNHDGQIALMGAGDGHGVQVSVSLLQPAQMDLFKSHFLDLLGLTKNN